MKQLFSALIFVLTISCSNLIDQIDDNILSEGKSSKRMDTTRTYCKANRSIQLISHSKKNHLPLISFIEKYNLSFAESIVVLTFTQMNERPDAATPMSTMTAIIDNEYIQIHNNKKYNLLYSLAHILKKHKAPRSLSYLAFLFDTNFPNNFIVTKEFSEFLYTNRVAIEKNKDLTKFYNRAGETLRENEKVPKRKVRPLIQKALKSFKTYKITKEIKSSKDIQCNYDIASYRKKNFKIWSDQDNTLTYGLTHKGKTALISLTHNIDFSNQEPNSIFFPGANVVNTPTMCFKNDKRNQKHIWLISSHSRDSAQHLTDLYQEKVFDSISKNEIDKSIRRARVLFLKNPNRSVFESERSYAYQKNELFKLRTPIYNSSSLGGIMSYFKNKKEESFILDDRLNSAITCK
jgi:hypothetical protein